MPAITAALDACVLYPAALRDALLGAAAFGMFQPVWSPLTIDETTRNLIADGRMTEPTAQRLAAALRSRFPAAIFQGDPVTMVGLSVHPGDRHVAGAAIAAQATYLVTLNLRHFPADAFVPYGVQPISPDGFLNVLFRRSSVTMLAVLRQQQAKLKRPPVTMDEVLRAVGLAAPEFVALVRPLLMA
jgi:hypothetical protein